MGKTAGGLLSSVICCRPTAKGTRNSNWTFRPFVSLPPGRIHSTFPAYSVKIHALGGKCTGGKTSRGK